MSETATKKVTVKVSQEMFLKMDERRYKEQTEFQAVGEALFTAWAKGEIKIARRGDSVQVVPGNHDCDYPYRAANSQLHEKLETILGSGDDIVLKAVVPNIEVFFARLKPAARRVSGR